MAFFSQSFSTRFRGRAGTVAGAGARQRPLEDEKPKEKELMQMQMQCMARSLAPSSTCIFISFRLSVCLSFLTAMLWYALLVRAHCYCWILHHVQRLRICSRDHI